METIFKIFDKFSSKPLYYIFLAYQHVSFSKTNQL